MARSFLLKPGQSAGSLFDSGDFELRALSTFWEQKTIFIGRLFTGWETTKKRGRLPRGDSSKPFVYRNPPEYFYEY